MKSHPSCQQKRAVTENQTVSESHPCCFFRLKHRGCRRLRCASRRPPGAMASDMVPSRIAANMRRMKDKGVDEKNPAHVQAYLVARQQTARPRPETILRIAKSAETKFKTQARMTS